MSGSLLEDAAKGAAMGAPFGGPIGAAVGGLGGVLAHYAPALISDLFGQPEAKAVELAQTAVQVVQQVTGSTEPQAVLQSLGDPAMETQLRVQLAQISADLRRAELDAQKAASDAVTAQLRAKLESTVSSVQAQMADIADARRTMSALSAGGSKIAWGAPVVSILVLTMFFLVIVLTLTRSMPSGSENVLNVLLGTLGAMATGVVSYWVGSNASTANSQAQFVAMSNKAADGVPPDIARQMLSTGVNAVVQAGEDVALPFLKKALRS